MNVLEVTEARGCKLAMVTRSSAKGAEWHGQCPGCGGTDRFHVWPDQNDGQGSYWCRQCGKKGDLIQWFRDFEGMSFPEACRAAGRDLPECRGFRQDAGIRAGGFEPKPAAPPLGVDRERWACHAERFVDRCHRFMIESAVGMDHLAGRGIDREMVEKYRLGWHAGENGKNCAFRDRSAWGLPPEKKADGTLKKLWIPRGLVIPFVTGGRVARVKIRRPKADRTPAFKLPYHFMPGGVRDMMTTSVGRKVFVIVEAELDAVAVDGAAGDLVGAVAIGTSDAKPDAALFTHLEAAHKILVATDADAAGVSAWAWWRETFPRAVRWPVPAGKDPGDAVAAGVNLRAWILAGLPPSVVVGNSIAERMARPVQRLDGWTAATPEGGQGEKQEEGRSLKAEGKTTGASSALQPSFEVPEGLTRFFGYLRKYPVSVYTVGGHMRLVEAKAWKNWDITREISRMMFFDDDVRLYLECHPAETIHRGNFWDGLGAR